MKDFKIEILNPEEVKVLFERWGRFAAKCYDTPLKFAERVGKSCLKSGHFSGSRTRYIEIDVTDVPRALVDQIIRKEQGFVKNVESGRYVDFSEFEWYTSPLIAGIPEAKEIYDNHMLSTRETYQKLVKILNDHGITGERAFEAARGVSPMNYRTGMVIGMTIESFIDLCHKRLCVRTQEHSRHLMKLIRDAVLEIVPELKPYAVIQCEHLMWCPEGSKCCGYYPTKEEVELKYKEIIKECRKEKREVEK